MCEKVNKDITFIQFFHSTRLHTTPLHWTIQNILLAANPTTAFLQKANWPGKKQFTISDVSVNRPSSADEGLLTETSEIVNCFLFIRRVTASFKKR